ncbi:bifunctional diguanylate cyclase/phosphodiesterase [Undibacterium sp. TJN19]|uniref:bifunctional diguanylate cyclase/phosphodiesterase n=1 Tax=Undibacterium sp. TJN19 TaxID=3413055 RepID=UPI003BF1C63D
METGGIRKERDVPIAAFALCICLIAAAIIGQSWWSMAQDKSLTINAAQEHNFLAVRILEEHVSKILRDAVQVMGVVSDEVLTETKVAPSDEVLIRQMLVRQRQESEFIFAISLFDTQGKRWVSSQQAAALADIQVDQTHIKYLLDSPENTRVVLGKPFQLIQTGHWVLPIAKSFFDISGKQIGLIQIDIDLRYFHDFYERIALGSSASIALYDESGKQLTGAQANTENKEADFSRTAIDLVVRTKSNEGVVRGTNADGKGVLISYRKIAEFPLTLVYSRDIETILADWNTRVAQKVMVTAMTAGFIFILALILLWQIRHLRDSKARLEASESRYRLLYQGAQDAILLIGRDYSYVDCNPAALQLFGRQVESEVIGRKVGSFSSSMQAVEGLPGQDKDVLVVTLIDQAFKGEPQRFEWVTVRHDQIQYNEISLSRVEVDGEMLVFCVIRDTNARKYTELLMEGQNHLLQLIGGDDDLPSILEAICQFVEKLCPHWRCGIQLLSEDRRSFAQATGSRFPTVLLTQIPGMVVTHGSGIWSEVVLTAQSVWLSDFQHAPAMQFVNAVETLSEFPSCAAWPIFGKNGQLLGSFTLFSYSRKAFDDKDLSLIRITVDIAGIAIEGRRSEKKIMQLAHYDELTGLPNRFLYNQHLSRSLAIAERNRSQLAVLFLDLDRFKNINDTFGHDEGDHVLRTVARSFRQCLRESDIIARIGGDEFILLIDQFNEPRDLGDVADKLLFEAAQPFDINGQECQLSASIGIATFPADGKDAQTLLKNADIAMYRAKNKGKDNYQFYASEMNTHTVERLAFEARLRKALERREFVVHYQPKLDVITERIVGAEALVRWNHPERGILYPVEFIALAEEAGLIARLGMLVLDIACRDMLSFRGIDKDFGRVAINLSGAQFNDANMLDEVKSVVDFWRVPSNSIEFEITESMVMHNREQAIQLMDGLKEAGFTLSIDDFGTGYSSLAYLKRFPVDSVKIDRSFIKDIPDDPNDTAIVLAIVAMAHTLGIKVIAEGVDSATQLATLRECKCDEYQGFYFSKAVSDKEFLQLLQRQAKVG